MTNSGICILLLNLPEILFAMTALYLGQVHVFPMVKVSEL